jgi:hypothetical protein
MMRETEKALTVLASVRAYYSEHAHSFCCFGKLLQVFVMQE